MRKKLIVVGRDKHKERGKESSGVRKDLMNIGRDKYNERERERERVV